VVTIGPIVKPELALWEPADCVLADAGNPGMRKMASTKTIPATRRLRSFLIFAMSHLIFLYLKQPNDENRGYGSGSKQTAGLVT
jgi:hypothetical protein